MTERPLSRWSGEVMNWTQHVKAYRYLTPDTLRLAMPRCPDPTAWALAFDEAIHRFVIRDIAMLLAQVGHESADLTRLEENLNYSAKRLTEVWPIRFPTLEAAQPYARNPEALANRVYSNRMGNGPPETGDGWRYRGEGPMQLTGLGNYQRFADAIGDDRPLQQPELLQHPELGALSACWFYAKHVPHGASIELATFRINGGKHGLADRRDRYERALRAMT